MLSFSPLFVDDGIKRWICCLILEQTGLGLEHNNSNKNNNSNTIKQQQYNQTNGTPFSLLPPFPSTGTSVSTTPSSPCCPLSSRDLSSPPSFSDSVSPTWLVSPPTPLIPSAEE